MIEKLKWNDATKKMPPDESVVLLWVRFPTKHKWYQT